jgi:dCMP deaminase
MNIHREKDFPLYQDMAVRVSEQSYAKRKQVGAVILAKTGMISLGWNGQPSGYPNQCELLDGTTDPLVIHAERNAIDKMTREGVSPYGSIVFVTLSPCLECAKSLAAVGVSAVYYRDLHRQEAIEHLNQMGIITKQWSK